MKTLLIGCGSMASEYYRVLKSLKINVDVVGRGRENAEKFEVDNKCKVISLDLDEYLNLVDIRQIDNAIVTVNIENLYNVCNKLLDNSIKKILLEKPGYLFDNEILDLKKKSNKTKSNIFIAYNRRFYSSVIKAKKLINKDGGIKSCFFDFTEWSHVIKDLDFDSKVKEKWFLANSSHVVDLVFYLIGKPKKFSNFTNGSLSWHSSSSRFVGCGITDQNVIFSYHSNWSGPGRWLIELTTNYHKLIFCPVEELKIIKLGTINKLKIKLNDNDDIYFKSGLYKQVNSFLKSNYKNLCSLENQVSNINLYNKICNYNS